MDFSKFLDDNFDTKDWVNAAFRSQPTGGNISKDQYATTLVMKLQMFIQEVNNVIEEASQQAVQNLPRVMREIDAVKQESILLQEQMRMVKEDIEKVEHDTAQSMQMLLQLDGIKSRMKAASEALQEADNWTTLSADVEQVFQSQDIEAISQKLVGMQQSLQVLVDVPDYEDRCQHLEALKNRLEAMLSPQLVSAFNSLSLETAQMYVRIFTDIDRLPELQKYYHKCQKGQLVQAWRSRTERDGPFIDCLSDFYDQLLSAWHTQVQWCSQVFSDPVPLVCNLLTETLQGIEPSIPDCISQTVQERPDTLQTLIELKEVSERFSRSIEGAIETHLTGVPTPACVMTLTAAIYSPYKPYIKQYSSFEEESLTKDLESIPLDNEEIIDCVRLLGESVSKLFSAANKANERCVQFTNGCGYVGLQKSMQKYFMDYVKEFRRVLTNLREKCKLDQKSADTEDWTLFQHSLRIIQTCGELIMHIEELDETLMSSILNSVGRFSQPMSPSIIKELDLRGGGSKKSPFEVQTGLFLDSPEDQAALESMISKVVEGESPSVLPDVQKLMKGLSEEVHRFAFDIVFAQLKEHLNNLANMEIWTSQSAGGAITSDLPTFSLSPQEYITKIGQYLMTLPQQLDPFTLEDNPAIMVSLKHGKLPYTSEQELPEHMADLWLESVARGMMHNYTEEVLRIPVLTTHATKQLVTDIDYLCNVLDDLGLQPSEPLKNVVTLLKASTAEYEETSEQMPQRISHAIRAMRNLNLDH